MDDLISGLLIPTERPPLALDVKRALLTFDQVNISAPDDRELINPVSFLMALSPIPLPIGIGAVDSVLPLGKLPHYDDVFEQTVEECDDAVRQGSLVVRASPQVANTGLFVGSVPNPDGWASPNWVMSTFLPLVTQRDVLTSVCRGLPSEDRLRRWDLAELAPGGAALTQGVGGPPQLPDLNDGGLNADVAAAVQRLAAARLGTIVKFVGFCENTGLHPIANDSGMTAALEHLQRASASSLASILDGRPEKDSVRLAMRVERIIFAHEVPDAVLSRLSVAEILRLRTRAWGRAGVARSAFFAAVRRLAEEHPSDEAFDAAVADAVNAYKAAGADLADEWKKLGIKLGLPLLGGVAAGDVLQNLLGTPTWSLAIGIAALGSGIAGVADEVVGILRQRKEITAGPGKALLSPYAFALE